MQSFFFFCFKETRVLLYINLTVILQYWCPFKTKKCLQNHNLFIRYPGCHKEAILIYDSNEAYFSTVSGFLGWWNGHFRAEIGDTGLCYCWMCSQDFCWIIYAWLCMWDALKSKKTSCDMKYWWLKVSKQVKMAVCGIKVTRRLFNIMCYCLLWVLCLWTASITGLFDFPGGVWGMICKLTSLGVHYVILSCQWCLHYFWYNGCLLLMWTIILCVNLLRFTSNMKKITRFWLPWYLTVGLLFYFVYFCAWWNFSFRGW